MLADIAAPEMVDQTPPPWFRQPQMVMSAQELALVGIRIPLLKPGETLVFEARPVT
ncbi:MAG: hypothetical protein ACK5KO_13640 [Arachnia sp.]